MDDLEQDRKNRELIEELRQTLERLAERLTPETDSALIYVVKEPTE